MRRSFWLAASSNTVAGAWLSYGPHRGARLAELFVAAAASRVRELHVQSKYQKMRNYSEVFAE
jgi:hypothetical protein